MRKEWQEPKLEVLNVKMTMAGPGLTIPDSFQPDPDPEDMVHHDS